MRFSLRGTPPGRTLAGPARFFLCLLPALAFPAFAGDASTFWKDPSWLKLLHYSRTWGGGYRQEFGRTFRLAETGDVDPRAELDASLAAIRRGDASFECRFPARAQLLRRIFSDLPQKPAACPEWESFRDRIDAASVELAFSSYYLNNPASAFGHSFLVLRRRGSSRSSELLDVGIGYAARVGDENAIAYAFKGMFGLFSGEYTALPYYYKVREYADAENRDLWTYRLDLGQAEVALLVAHLWELGHAQPRYYYFSRNCSYEILAILEAIRPSSQLIDRLPWFVIPSHTLQSLMAEPGLVAGIGFRKSARARLLERVSLLSSQERELFDDGAQTESLEKLAPEARARVLDARIEWIDFKYFKALTREEREPKELKQKTLSERAATGIVDNPIEDRPPAGPPHAGHPPRRLQLEAVSPGGYEISFRPALQDLLDPAEGYPATAQLEFTQVRVRLRREGARLERATLFQAQSLSPVSRISLAPSWRVGLALERPRSVACRGGGMECLALGFELGGGPAVALSEALPWTLYGFALTRALASSEFSGARAAAAVGVELGSHLRFRRKGSPFEGALLGAYRWDTLSSEWRVGTLMAFRRDWAVQGSFTDRSKAGREWSAGVSYYY